MLSLSLPRDLAGGAIMRNMTAADIPAVHTIELTLFPGDAWPLDFFFTELAQPSRAYVVIEKSGQIIGYAGAMSIADTADIQTIAVLPAHEGRGYGRALLEHLHREVKTRGARQVLLEVRADNPRAQRLYYRSGYEHIHTRYRYYSGGIDALIMQKTLKPEEDNRER